jgi:hypothetical protein
MGFALDNLGEDECRRIAAELFTVTDAKAKLNGMCPFHGDKKTPSFYYNPAKDSCGCSSCGVYGDLIKLWSHVFGLDSKTDGFKAFCREFGITGKGKDGTPKKRERPPPPPPKPKGAWKRRSDEGS